MTSDPPYANSLADPALLSKIDQLFACGVGTYIDLPQLVVVGDQSSGKGSVLEGGLGNRIQMLSGATSELTGVNRLDRPSFSP